MAFLMLLHEKMRLQRKINKLTLKQLHMGNIQERMQKKIDKREKYYSKLEKQLERQATAYKNYANNYANSIFTSGFDPSGIYSGSMAGMGTSALQAQAMQAAITKFGLAGNEDALQLYMSGGSMNFKPTAATENEKDATKKKFTSDQLAGKELDAKQYAALSQAAQFVQQYQSQMQQQIQGWKTAYTEQVDQWLEVMKEQLDGQKEFEMDLLEEEQSDMEAEKNSVEAQLQLAKDRKESIEQELGSSIKDAAPKFGLA